MVHRIPKQCGSGERLIVCNDLYCRRYSTKTAQSALFAGVSSQLYSFFTDVKDNYAQRHSPPAAITLMILLSYASMLFNTGAAMRSFVSVDTLSDLQSSIPSIESFEMTQKSMSSKM